MTKKTQDCLPTRIQYPVLPNKSGSCSPQFPEIYGLLLNEEGMLHSGKHGPVPGFLRCAAAIKFKTSLTHKSPETFLPSGKLWESQCHFKGAVTWVLMD